MKKRILSLVLTVALMVGIIYPALQVGAKAVNDKVMLSAAASDNITIKKADTLPEEADFNGELTLSTGTFKIERDYQQKATVNVTNTSKSTVEYYLVAKNIYKDIYMNFVRNGSPDSPLVIQPGETQNVQLDIFAQNAEQGEYTIPVYAWVIKGTKEVEDAKATMTLTCDIVTLNMACKEIASSESTLAKTLRLTNKGEALTDVTLSFEGDLKDYVQLNPIVSNYQMNKNAHIDVKAIPDLTKMKNNNVSAISGKLVASSGGQRATFDLTFDTKGEPITSTTMGELALKQSGNPFYNLEPVKDSGKADVQINGTDLTFTSSSDFTFGENADVLGLDFEAKATIYKGDSNKFSPSVELVSCDENGFKLYTSFLIPSEEWAALIEAGLAQQTDTLSTESIDNILGYVENILKAGGDILYELALDADSANKLLSEVTKDGVASVLAGLSIVGDSVDAAMFWADPNNSTDSKILYGLLAVYTIVLTVLPVFVPGIGFAITCIVCSLIANLLKEYMKQNPDAEITLDINGYQCTNAGAIRNNVYVNDFVDTPIVRATGVIVSPGSVSTEIKKGVSLSATVSPADATNKSVSWSSSDTSVAYVSPSGYVTPVGAGTTVITAKTYDGGYTDSCVVTVTIPVESVMVRPGNLTLSINDSYSLEAEVLPENATNKTLRWSSSDTEVLEVSSSGCVTAKAPGKATVTATSHNNKASISFIEVLVPEAELIITPENPSVPKGKTGSLSVELVSEYESISSVSFASLDESIATVDADGTVTGHALGATTVVVTVTTDKGNEYKASKAVNVHVPVEEVAIFDYEDFDLNTGDQKALTALVFPEDAANKNVTWSSSDESVVTVDANGVVTAVSDGEATVTVTTEEGGFADSVTFSVTTPDTRRPEEYITITSRMYGGDGVGKWYGSNDPDYVDIQPTQYNYTINGTPVGSSFNSGVTDVAIAKLPADNIRYGAVNTIVCDYTTNPGHYFVNTDTQITMLYPADTPISYIGTPKDLQDVRSLPDFAIYSENIFSSDSNVVIGNTATLSMNVYNRGSSSGWFNIEVSDGQNVLYSEKNRYIDAFSGETITCDWTPTKELTDITVTLTNSSADFIDERTTENNKAVRTFKARQRVVPAIDSITPDYVTEGEAIVFATVSKYDDVTKVDFYVDGVLYAGEVKSSVTGGKMRYWINDPTITAGERTIKVVVTYATGNTTTATIDSTATITVLEANWNKYEFVLDSSFLNPSFFIYNKNTESYSRTYAVSRNGENCVLTITKEMYDTPADYILFVSCYNGFVYKSLSDKTTAFDYDACNTLEFIGNENITFTSMNYKSFDGKAVNVFGGYNSSVNVTPAKYNVEVKFVCFGETKTANLEVDLESGDKKINLASLVSSYVFEFKDEVKTEPVAKMYYRQSPTGEWNSFMLKQSFSEGKLTCIVPDVNSDLFNNAVQAFVLVTTDDSAFVTDVKPASDLPEIIVLDKANLQKYHLAADEEFSEVRVVCDKFSVTLYGSTLYLQPGDYNITIIFNNGDIKTEGLLYSQSADSKTSNITIDWAKAYFETGAYVYAIGKSGEEFTKEDYTEGTDIAVVKDVYTVKTNITRNDSYYIVESAADASEGDAEISIGNSFEGKITNTFGTLDGGSTIRMYLDNLVDSDNNKLTYFNSKNADDNLVGYVTFTDVTDSKKVISVYVSLDNVASFDVRLPDISGTYKVSLEVMTENEKVYKTSGIELDVSEITLSLNETYTFTPTVYPENATYNTVIWSSSNPDVVSVDENGKITASKYEDGTAEIIATTEDGEYNATCKVTVKLNWWQKILKLLLLNPVYRYFMDLIY